MCPANDQGQPVRWEEMETRNDVAEHSAAPPCSPVAVLEVATGNESVGTAWLECLVLDSSTTVGTLIAWRDSVRSRNGVASVGKMILATEDCKAAVWVPK